MDGDVQKPRVSWEVQNGTLASMEHLRIDRADSPIRAESPIPGLVEGTEPGETD